MFKKYKATPKRLSLNLRINNTLLPIIFLEPTIYNILLFQDFIEYKEYEEAIKILGINIDREVFYISPEKILLGIYDLLIGEKEKNTQEEIFEPAFYDRICKLYGTDYLYIIKNYTPTQLSRLIAGLDYNNNIDNKKQNDNLKYKQIQEVDMQKYEEIYDLDIIKNYKFTI